MRVTSDRQTLILAGETPPPPGESRVSSSLQRVTIISARVDASMIVTQSEHTPESSVVAYNSVAAGGFEAGSALPASMTADTLAAYASSTRGSSYNGAGAYARTQDLSDRLTIIDTYA